MICKSYLEPFKQRKLIYKENKNQSGIYCLINFINNKIYAGSTINITNRLYNYLSPKHMEGYIKKNNSLIYKAILKHGYGNFKFNTLKYCNYNELIKWEQHYINILNPEYNILKIARSNLGFKHLAKKQIFY